MENEKPTKSSIASQMARMRWDKTTPEERKAFMERVQMKARGTPRKPDVPRCPCGKMTLARALARAGSPTGKSLGHLRGCSFYKRRTRKRG
jgi:hypothetical protein